MRFDCFLCRADDLVPTHVWICSYDIWLRLKNVLVNRKLQVERIQRGAACHPVLWLLLSNKTSDEQSGNCYEYAVLYADVWC